MTCDHVPHNVSEGFHRPSCDVYHSRNGEKFVCGRQLGRKMSAQLSNLWQLHGNGHCVPRGILMAIMHPGVYF